MCSGYVFCGTLVPIFYFSWSVYTRYSPLGFSKAAYLLRSSPSLSLTSTITDDGTQSVKGLFGLWSTLAFESVCRAPLSQNGHVAWDVTSIKVFAVINFCVFNFHDFNFRKWWWDSRNSQYLNPLKIMSYMVLLATHEVESPSVFGDSLMHAA